MPRNACNVKASRAQRRIAGFTLIEIVIALTIAALSITALARIFTSSVIITDRAGGITLATLIAQSKLAQAGTAFPLEDGSQSGEDLDGRYRWQLTIVPYEVIRLESVDAPTAVAPLAQPLEMKRITVTVTYDDPARVVTLTTYKSIGKKV